MLNKKILSLVTLGLLASPLTLGTVNAEGNKYSFSQKMTDRHVKNPLQYGILDFHTVNQLGNEIKYSRSLPPIKEINKKGTMNNSTSSDDDFILEIEPNEEFANADNTSYAKPLLGQLLSSDDSYDYDLHKVVVPRDGLLYVAGAATTNKIDLAFAAWEKNYVESNKLVYLDNWTEDGIEYQVYQAKAGTYYVEAYDLDEDKDIDDNTKNDKYFIATAFVDNVAPTKPTVNKVDNNDTVVTGKAEANSTVTVKVGSTQIGTAKASSTGIYSVKIATQKAGVTLSIYAKDAAGNTSVAATTKVVDVIAPAKPVVNKVDNNDKVVTGKAETGSTVTVKKGTTVLGTAKANSSGIYSVTLSAVQSAGTKLTVTAKDAAGNTSVAATTTVVDVIAPAKPVVNKVDNNDKVVTGKAEANSTVTVKKGTTVLGTAKANSSGIYSVTLSAVQSAGTKLAVTAKDVAGNVSVATTVTVVDIIAPGKPQVNKVDDNDLIVTGKAEANSTITVKVGSKVLGTAKADSKGNFTVTITAQKKDTIISVTAKDASGNTSQATTLKIVSH